MKYKIILVLLVFLTFFLTIRHYFHDSKRILIIGDSITQGVGATNNYGYAQMLKEELKKDKVIVSGIGGDNILKINERLDELLIDPFDIVILQVGVNDSRFRPSLNSNEVSILDFEKGIEDFAQKMRQTNKNIVLNCLTLTRVDESKTRPFKPDKHYINQEIEKYENKMIEKCKELGINIIQIPTLIEEPNLLVDGVHPTDKGYKNIFNSVLKFLIK